MTDVSPAPEPADEQGSAPVAGDTPAAESSSTPIADTAAPAEAAGPASAEAPAAVESEPAESSSIESATAPEAPAATGTDEAPTAAAESVEAPAGSAGTSDSSETSDAAEGPTFDALDLPPALRRAVADLGFERPSAIQARAIPPLLQGRDVVGVAQTGTGKTAAFGLPLLAAVDPSVREVQGIVMAPTRELAMQVADAIASFAAPIGGLDVVAVYGGSPYGPQERALARGAQVVVGTPGRVMDHMRRSNLRLDTVRFAVLDEADEMLRMGFSEDVEEILSHTPSTRQVALFSATMPPAIRRVADEHMQDPVRVSVTPQSSTVASVHQTYALVPFRHRTGALSRVLATSEAEAAIVFVRTRAAAEEVGTELVARGHVAAAISGDVPQKEREKIVERLRDGSLKVLVATDVAARGLDVEKIGLVVNFDVPREPEAYVHRIGRTGRAGRSGEALTFIGPHERRALKNIERATKQRLEEAVIPSPRDVSKHRLATLLTKVPERAERGRLELYRELISGYIAENEVDPAELAAVLAAMAVGDEGPGTSREDEEIPTSFRDNDRDDRRGRDRDRDRDDRRGDAPRTEHGYTSYRIGVGHSHGAKPAAIVGAIAGEGGVPGKEIGKVSIFGSFSLVQIRGSLGDEQLAQIGRAKVAGRELRIGPDNGPRGGGRGGRDGDDRGRGGYRRDSERSYRRDDDRSHRDRGGDRGGYRRDGESRGRRDDGGRYDSKRRGPRRSYEG
ncbi:DEAD/DEAH box helicase [Brachybacterium sp. DNPG3]